MKFDWQASEMFVFWPRHKPLLEFTSQPIKNRTAPKNLTMHHRQAAAKRVMFAKHYET